MRYNISSVSGSVDKRGINVGNYLSDLNDALDAQPIRAISCDVFDTLIFRQAGTVEQLWYQLGEQAYQLGLLHNDDPDAFVEYRREAEAMARRFMMQREGHREVRLEHIYACWPSSQGEQLSQLEQQMEYDNWWLNPVLVAWLASQQHNDIPIVLLSDMYLPASLLQCFFSAKAPQLLLHKIYVSSEYQASKQDGRLYQCLLAEQNWLPASVLHIGDDKITDLQMAKASGLSVCHVGLGDDLLAQLKYEQRLFRCTIPGLERLRRQWRWHSDGSVMSRLASRVYAPVLYAFARWVVARCQQQGIRTLFCLLREGDVIARLVQQIPGHDLSVKTLAISRRSTFLPSRDWSMDLVNQLSQRRGYTLAELLEDLGLECPVDWIPLGFHTLSDLVQTTHWHEVLSWLTTAQPLIIVYLQQQRQWLLQYLSQQGVKNAPEVAILDWGCGGSLLQNLHLVAGLDDVNYFMFYASQRANRVALMQKLHVFQSAACKEWAQQLAAYPEISEILLNGSLYSTRAYQQVNEGIITRVSVQRPDESIRHDAYLDEFIKTILDWGKLAAETSWLEQEPSISERHYFVAILYRLILYPMWQEACVLASLPLPLTSGESIPLVSPCDALLLKEIVGSGVQAYQLLLDGVNPIIQTSFWYPGIVALAFPDQLQLCGELATYQDDEKVAPMLLQLLQEKNKDETALYGAGDLGLRVHELLTLHGIRVTHIIDRRAERSSLYMNGIKVISLSEASNLKLKTYSVASRAFCTEIVNSIKSTCNDTSPMVEIFTYKGCV
ncbi:hypothetical protein GWQ29_10150 [Aeromonas sp. 2HA2]|uniref:hypothetical protein n=1 Tax=Aeromonas TaxID=642 RepID=UPI0023DDEF2B|nr:MULTISPECIES: hypothetical protein [Aeromonas]MDF2409781.1 hypothetical protein [Aeromonas sp. 2HA2]MDM5062874.1 hypothetical protein [Aeromonas salmonicida]